jgi:peptidoglycan/LPS O-acetylase OafA/YrhL
MTISQWKVYILYIISLIIFTYKTINLLQGNYNDIFTQQILIMLSLICTVIFAILTYKFITEDI